MKRILIYRFGNLGDIVCAMPAMTAIRKHFPDAWIGFLSNKEKTGDPDPEEILEGNSFLDKIITYDTKKLRKPAYSWEFLKKLHALRIDLLVYLARPKSTYKRHLRDYLFFRSAGCRELIGFRHPKPAKTYIKNGILLPVYTQEVDRLMTLLTPLEIKHTEINFCLPIKEKDIRAVDAIWQNHDLANGNPVVAICPGGKWPVKLWDISNFIRVALTLEKKLNVRIVLIGGSSDSTSGKEIVARTGNSVVNLIGKTNYMESSAILSRCNLLVSNDCGSVHLAAAVGTPVVGIYSSRDFPGRWHPWGENHTILRNDSVPCRFCFRTECKTMECINSITVDQVIESCQTYLKHSTGISSSL